MACQLAQSKRDNLAERVGPPTSFGLRRLKFVSAAWRLLIHSSGTSPGLERWLLPEQRCRLPTRVACDGEWSHIHPHCVLAGDASGRQWSQHKACRPSHFSRCKRTTQQYGLPWAQVWTSYVLRTSEVKPSYVLRTSEVKPGAWGAWPARMACHPKPSA